ncbi:hypothetical protein N181_21685 [Sinorhizobium fredii USDA 205]|nr:hypothetical protein N181_21685 [Sinorhizobium fredii USDA 205]
MLRGKRLHSIDRKQKLKVHRLLGPQRAIIVKNRNTLRHGYEIRRPLGGYALDERDDRLFGLALIPGGKRICAVQVATNRMKTDSR